MACAEICRSSVYRICFSDSEVYRTCVWSCVSSRMFSCNARRCREAEVTDACDVVLFRQVLDVVKASPVVSIGCDEGSRSKSFFVIRVHYLDGDFRPHTLFWQVHRLYVKDHKSLFDAIIQSFTQPPGSPWSASDMFTREEFLRKLVALTADGASVMGVQRSGRPLSEPRPGPIGNLAYSLAQAKEEFNEERLLTVWCAPHRLDLVAAKVERHPSRAICWNWCGV